MDHDLNLEWSGLLAGALAALKNVGPSGAQAASIIAKSGEVPPSEYMKRVFDPSVPQGAAQGFVGNLIEKVVDDLGALPGTNLPCPGPPVSPNEKELLLPWFEYDKLTTSTTAGASLSVIRALFHKLVLAPIMKSSNGFLGWQLPYAGGPFNVDQVAVPGGSNVATLPIILAKVIPASEGQSWTSGVVGPAGNVGPNYLALSAYALVATRELPAFPKLAGLQPTMATLPTIIKAAATDKPVGGLGGAVLATELADSIGAGALLQGDPILASLAITKSLALQARVTADWACRLYAALLLAGRVDVATAGASVAWFQGWTFLTTWTNWTDLEKMKSVKSGLVIGSTAPWVGKVDDPLEWAAGVLQQPPVALVNA